MPSHTIGQAHDGIFPHSAGKRRTALALALLSLSLTPHAHAATQTASSPMLNLSVGDKLLVGVQVQPSTGGALVKQYYGTPETNVSNWGSIVLVGSDKYSAQKLDSQGGKFFQSLPEFTSVSNTLTAITGGRRITTEVRLGVTDLYLIQTFTHLDGKRQLNKRWRLENRSATTTYNNLKLLHGGDTQFGNVDEAFGFFDPAKTMVYVRNQDYTNWGFMGFYANPASPADAYCEGQYTSCNQLAAQGNLNNQIKFGASADFHDAGYWLQWNRSDIAPGEAWEIDAYEIWTDGGPVQILAPASQNVAPNSKLTLPFTVQNLTAKQSAGVDNPPAELDLTAVSGPWNSRILGATHLSLDPESSATVQVEVTVPASAVNDEQQAVALTAKDGQSINISADATLTVVDLNVNINPPDIDFGSVPKNEAKTQVITLTNSSGNAIRLGNLNADAPFSLSADNCSGKTLADGESCTATLQFTGSEVREYNGALRVPIQSPKLLTRTSSLHAQVINPVNGACGSAANLVLNTAPSADLCTAGTASAVSSATASFNWDCAGESGGTNASCAATRAYTATPSTLR